MTEKYLLVKYDYSTKKYRILGEYSEKSKCVYNQLEIAINYIKSQDGLSKINQPHNTFIFPKKLFKLSFLNLGNYIVKDDLHVDKLEVWCRKNVLETGWFGNTYVKTVEEIVFDLDIIEQSEIEEHEEKQLDLSFIKIWHEI